MAVGNGKVILSLVTIMSSSLEKVRTLVGVRIRNREYLTVENVLVRSVLMRVHVCPDKRGWDLGGKMCLVKSSIPYFRVL